MNKGEMMFMKPKEQLQKLRKHWLAAALVVGVLVIFLMIGTGRVATFQGTTDVQERGWGQLVVQSAGGGGGGGSGRLIGAAASESLQNLLDRKVATDVTLSTEIERGTFQKAEQQLKATISANKGLILDEKLARHGSGRSLAYEGSYRIKISPDNYDRAIAQLKAIGGVVEFTQHSEDISDQYVNTQVEIDTEKSRLVRYNRIYADAVTIEEKLSITNLIFEQERKIKYLEDALKNSDQRLEYVAIALSLQEKRSAYADIVVVKFAQLAKLFVARMNGLLEFLFVVLPFGIAALMVWLFVRFVRRRRQ